MSEAIDWGREIEGLCAVRFLPGEQDYAVTTSGEVFSRKKDGCWKRIRGAIEKGGYVQMVVWRGGRRVTTYEHRLVLEAFVGPRPDGFQTCHGNGCRSDNRLANLRWDSPKSNQADRVIHGTSNLGERNVNAKLNSDKVRTIRSLYATGTRSYASLADEFGVTHGAVQHAVTGRTWRQVR